jgi:hypothetical protein
MFMLSSGTPNQWVDRLKDFDRRWPGGEAAAPRRGFMAARVEPS